MSTIDNSKSVRVSYNTPLVATIAASLVLLLVVIFLAAIGLGNTITLIHQEDGLSAAFCGVVTLVLLVGVAFFATAVIKGVRDLFTPLQLSTGLIVELTARAQRGGGAYWVMIDPDLEAETPAPVGHYIPLSESPALGLDHTRRVFGVPSNTDPAPEPEPEPEPDLDAILRGDKGHLLRFRVDKPVHQSLRLDERVSIAHSRYLQHVYYVQQWQGNSSVVLQNRSLL